MLLYFFSNLYQSPRFINLFGYVSVRSIMALLTSLFLCISIFGPWFIKKSFLLRTKVREFVPESHKIKDYTPTMGGIFILLSSVFTILLWCNLSKAEVLVMICCLLSFGAIGFVDDYYKVFYKKGITSKNKLILQILASFFVSALWIHFCNPSTILSFPFFKNLSLDLGNFFIFWMMFVLISVSNAVNFTDGLDGLAISSLIPNFATFAVICYLSGHCVFANYLNIQFSAMSEFAIVGAALIGSSIGFLWFNSYPAEVFMGDIGSLSLGAALGLMAISSKYELILILSGALFVIEILSVILQVSFFKISKKRLLKMAPVHHHFELMGCPETKITVRFAIISMILCTLALVSLKIR